MKLILKISRRFRLVIVFSAFSPSVSLAAGGNSSSSGLKDDVAAINQAIAEFTKAYKEGNVEAVLKVFSDDLVYMPQGRPTKSGKQAVDAWRSSLQGTFAKYKGHLEVIIDE